MSEVVKQGAYKALLLGSLAVRDPSVQGNMLFSANGVKELALAISLQRDDAIKWKVNCIGGVLKGGAERQDVPMTQSLKAVSTPTQDSLNAVSTPTQDHRE